MPFAKRLAPFTLKSQQFEYEYEHRDAEHEHEFAPKVTSSFFRGTPRGGLADNWSLLFCFYYSFT